MNKHDTVIGYIEYLDCNGCVRERIPYVDAEKFRTRIYASLYCGEPIIPVLFPENLSQPLLFEKGTIFPWGLRRKKYELLPYEIYQTNNREIAFLRYDYTKGHINAASYKLVYRGQMECWQTLDSLYCLHNQENRPNGRKMRSLSVSDIMPTPPASRKIFRIIWITPWRMRCFPTASLSLCCGNRKVWKPWNACTGCPSRSWNFCATPARDTALSRWATA